MIKILFCFLLAAAIEVPQCAMAQSSPDVYNVSWDTPGPGSAASMPLGNGDIGLNVWVDTGGDLLFYISKTNAWGAKKTRLRIPGCSRAGS